MHFIKTLGASLLLAGSAVAQTSGSDIVVHVVAVSSTEKNTFTFSPQNVEAKPGEMVQFQFHNGNHTVTQSNFANPCEPINKFQQNVTGFHSGFQAVSQGATSIPTYTILVNSTAPIWYYCAQGKHCQAGMVGAVNVPVTGNKTMQAFVSLAAQAPESTVPQANTGTNSPASGSSSSALGSAPTSTTSTASSETSASTTASSSAAVASGAASGSLFASPRQVLSGGIVAALLAALL